MPKPLPQMDLLSLTDFNAVAIHGGFGPAARALDRPKATLSRRVGELEASLGVRLIERGSRKMRLTEEGQALHVQTRALINELQEVGAALSNNAPIPTGRLRISAPVVFAHRVLCKIATRFVAAYPQVSLEIVAEDRLVNPVDDGYDLVIRIDPAADERLFGRRILQDERWLVSAQPLPALHENETPGAETDMAIPAVLSMAQGLAPWSVTPQHFSDKNKDPLHATIQPIAVLRLSSLLMVREAVLEGLGAALLPRLLVENDVAEGRLLRYGTENAPPVEIWALYHSRRLLNAKVRVFLDLLLDLLAERLESSPNDTTKPR